MTFSNAYLERVNNPPSYAEHTARLLRWSHNETYPSTATLFAYLTGLAQNDWGLTVYPGELSRGYLETSFLAHALEEYATHPDAVVNWFRDTLAVEYEEPEDEEQEQEQEEIPVEP